MNDTPLPPSFSPKRFRLCPSHILALFSLSFAFVHGIEQSGSTEEETTSYLRASRNVVSSSLVEDPAKNISEPELTNRELDVDFGLTMPIFTLGRQKRNEYKRTWDHNDLFVSFKQNVGPGETPWNARALFEEPRVQMQGSNFFTDTRIMSNRYNGVKDAIKIDAKLEVSIFIGSAKGEGSYYKEITSTKTHMKYLMQIVHQAFVIKPENRHELKPSTRIAKMLEDPNSNYNKIVDEYGSFFVDQIIYGSGLNVLYEFTSATEINMEEIKARVTVKIGIGWLSVSKTFTHHERSGFSKSNVDMKITIDSTGITDWVSPGTTNDFGKANEAVNSWKKQFQRQKQKFDLQFGRIKQYNIDQNDYIRHGAFDSCGFDTVALAMLPIHPHLSGGNLDKHDVDVAQSRLVACVEKLKEIQFMMALLAQQDEDFRRLTSRVENYMDKPFYYKWIDQKAAVEVHFETIIKQIIDFRKLSIYQIVNYDATDLAEITRDISPSDRKLVDALTGSYVHENPQIENKVYKNAFWIGYALDRGCAEIRYCAIPDASLIDYVPQYRGYLKCDYSDAHGRESDQEYNVPEEIALNVPEDLCTGVPTAAPTSL